MNSIELELLGDIKGKNILHLQCHFGQDTMTLSRMGAKATGVDLSDRAIDRATEFAKKLNLDTTFICCDIYDAPNYLDEKFDFVFNHLDTSKITGKVNLPMYLKETVSDVYYRKNPESKKATEHTGAGVKKKWLARPAC